MTSLLDEYLSRVERELPARVDVPRVMTEARRRLTEAAATEVSRGTEVLDAERAVIAFYGEPALLAAGLTSPWPAVISPEQWRRGMALLAASVAAAVVAAAQYSHPSARRLLWVLVIQVIAQLGRFASWLVRYRDRRLIVIERSRVPAWARRVDGATIGSALVGGGSLLVALFPVATWMPATASAVGLALGGLARRHSTSLAVAGVPSHATVPAAASGQLPYERAMWAAMLGLALALLQPSAHAGQLGVAIFVASVTVGGWQMSRMHDLPPQPN